MNQKSALLVTDGDCGFCQNSAEFLAKYFAGDWRNQPSQNIDYKTLGLTEQDVLDRVWFVQFDGDSIRKWGGAQAVAKLLLFQSKFWIKPLAVLAFAPVFKQIADLLYKIISRNRGKLPGASAACEI